MKRILTWVGISVGTLVGLLLLAAMAAYILSSRRINKIYAVPPAPKLNLSYDSLTLARGAHLARSTANCVYCHGDDFGGQIYMNPPRVVTVAGPNLTRGRGGIGATFTDADWIRAIRHGVRRDGTSLILMPSEVFVHLNRDDLSALISYLKQVPPVDRVMPTTEFGPVGRALLAVGKLSLLVAEKTVKAPLDTTSTPGPTIEYGRYLADVSACRGCHGLNLSGGRLAGPPGTPLTSNLTPAGAIGSWTEEQFVKTLRTGVRPNGKKLDDFMPWRLAGQMTDQELHAIWLYLKSVPPREFGNR